MDAITIATPDHWHAPMAIAGLQAGKHVYVEKPCSHNPAEGALLVEAQKKYGKLVQMGTQQRSSPHTIEIVDKIHNGLIGRAYYGKSLVQQHAQVDRRRQAGAGAGARWIGICGRARRRARRTRTTCSRTTGTGSEIWGTGETLNNGTHEVDVCRWALGVDYPQRMTAIGGRYHVQG